MIARRWRQINGDRPVGIGHRGSTVQVVGAEFVRLEEPITVVDGDGPERVNRYVAEDDLILAGRRRSRVDKVERFVASKHGVIGMTKTAALEYASEGIRINAISPGLTESGMTAGLDQRPELADDLIALIPMGHMGLSQNIADGVVWLCDDTASFVTGHVLVIDGGQTIA